MRYIAYVSVKTNLSKLNLHLRLACIIFAD